MITPDDWDEIARRIDGMKRGNPFDDIPNTSARIKDLLEREAEAQRTRRYEEEYYDNFSGPSFFQTVKAIIGEAFASMFKRTNPPSNGGGGDGGNDEPPTHNEGNFMRYLNWKSILGVVLVLLILILAPFIFGINNAGQRTVVQYPNGTLFVKFEPGLYWQWFGKADVYNDVLTYDFDRTAAEGETSLDVDGIPVRYQDGGTGTIFGKARFNLPNDEATMLSLHRAFRSNQGVAYKLLKTVTDEAQNLTAGLMTSEGAYAEQRGTYIEWSRDQVTNGKYRTRLKQEMVKDEVTGRSVVKNVPVIAYGEDGLAERFETDLKTYGVTVSGYQITDWGFEKKTLDQIAEKRKATMAIITSKANAEKAKQEAITAEENGKRDVTVAKYEKEQEKIRAVVDAEKAKAVAILGAEKLVEVARQKQLENEQLKLAALEYEEQKKAEGRGDAEYKRLVLEADGALQQKLDAMVQMNADTATALANRKVPTTVFYTGGMGVGEDGQMTGLGTDGDVRNVLATQLLKNVQALGVEMQPKK